TAAAGKGEFHAEDAAVAVEADLVVGDEVVTLAGDQHVVVAVGPKLHGTAELLREQRGDAGEQARLAFLAAESASHPAAVDDDGKASGAPRLVDGTCGYREDRLADVLDECGREDRIVGDDGAIVVLAGDVLRGQHGDDARRREHFREVDRLDPRVRTLAHPD